MNEEEIKARLARYKKTAEKREQQFGKHKAPIKYPEPEKKDHTIQ